MVIWWASVFTDDLAAWATAAAAVGTVATLAFLAMQLAIDRAAQRRRAKREQAESVSAWFGSDWMHPDPERKVQRIELLNSSRQPVYQVVALLALVQGGGAQDSEEGVLATTHHGGYHTQTLLVLPPGRYYTTVPAAPTMMFRRYGVELAFTDRAGIHWRRTALGGIKQITKAPPDYYELPMPRDWASPEEVLPGGTREV